MAGWFHTPLPDTSLDNGTIGYGWDPVTVTGTTNIGYGFDAGATSAPNSASVFLSPRTARR